MSRLRGWFLPHRPDIVGLLVAQAEVTLEGLAAFRDWSRDGAVADADRVLELEGAGDDARRDLLEALNDALVTAIGQEDAYELSERIDEVLDRAKDTVLTARALGWRPDDSATAMGGHVHESFSHLVAAMRGFGDRRGRPGADAERAITSARAIEHDLQEGLASLTGGGDPWALATTLAVYRSYSNVGVSLLRIADRTWYAVLKAL